MLRGEQSSPAPHAIASGLLFVMRHLVLVGAAALPMIAACRSADTGAPPAAAIAAPVCAARPLAFRPRTGVQYAALTEQQQGSVYGSRLAFTPVAGGWRAVESDFSLNRPTPVDVFGELRGAELHWNLDASGVPRGAGEPIGSAKPQYLANMTYYAFAPAGLATKSTCPGTAWETRWEENERIRTFHYRIESADDARVRIHVDGLTKTTHNEWRVAGTLDVSMADGLTGTGDLHVTGPGAPATNDYPRTISIGFLP